LCNGGIMAVDGARLFGLLDRITNDNAKGEFYLTDIVSLARGDGLGVQVVIGEEVEMMGCDSRIGLARAEHVMQQRLRFNAMGGGVTLLAPGTVVMSHDTVIGQDTVIHPNVVIGPGVEIGERCEIKSFSHLEGAKIEAGALIGPYARLRPGAEIGEGAHIGNFVEIKNATIEAGAKANHLSYIGDGQVGAGANIGAGTITCNYDGFLKHQTNIGAGAFIGSNTALVAPVTIGEGAIVGAGSTITRDVPADALAVERADEKIVEGAAGRLRARGKVAKGAADKGKK
ncbi:MAG: bifunctional UDP-N-acetylglucosamine diphosphorylase/glucosamine-1-phosphate N-acetyltransferase GlmU, partial [Rhodospirillaceae bacterium]|nr:bifunctional UDP-N-acetylglucosamine diphosphorylase/glucosamine-1-phosphate N-acetyltransferase GlmU [Rhodospirillaceae bacterium]